MSLWRWLFLCGNEGRERRASSRLGWGRQYLIGLCTSLEAEERPVPQAFLFAL